MNFRGNEIIHRTFETFLCVAEIKTNNHSMTNSLLPAHRSGLDGRSAAKPRHRLLQRSSPASKFLTIISGVLLLSVGMVQAGDKAAKPSVIMCATDGPALVVLAARELRRY
jgi:hypothetical protein